MTRTEAGHRNLVSSSTLAWILALVAVVILAQYLAFLVLSGLTFAYDLVIVSQIMSALVGALIASHNPRNTVGWLLIAVPLAMGIIELPFEYGFSVISSHSSLPFAAIALWFSNWADAGPFGLAFAMVGVRFPDGRVPRGWRFVDWLAVAGTVAFMIAVAFRPGPILQIGRVEVDNPFGLTWAAGQLAVLFAIGLGLIGAAVVAAIASLLARYRRADHELRLQLKWILLTSSIVMVAFVFAVVAVIFFHASLRSTQTPFDVAINLIPPAIGVAILRHRLFDIDLIISRTIVYAIITAILGGLYVAVIELTQRMFVIYAGQRSDTAIVITAFVVATAFTPVQKWAERAVERRLGGHDPAEKLDAFTSSIEAVVRVIDPLLAARRLVEECVVVFDAVGGALYLDSYGHSEPFHTHGHLDGVSAIEVAVRHAERRLGRLLLGHRRGRAPYSERDQRALQRSADALGQALYVGADMARVTKPGHHADQ